MSRFASRLRVAPLLTASALAACTGDAFESTGAGGAAASSSAVATGSTAAGTTSTTDGAGPGGGEGNGGDASATSSSVSTTGGDGGSGQGGDGGAPGVGGGGGDGGAGGDPGPVCDLVDGQAIDARCGVFVNLDAADAGDGTQASPFNAFGTALASADGRPLYVCASNAGIVGETVLSASFTLVGGLDCQTWEWTESGRTTWTAGADEVPLRVEGAATDVSIRNFAITAEDATVPGGSSIALFVDEATVNIERCEIVAGDGAEGESLSAEPAMGRADSGKRGSTADDICANVSTPGGAGGVNTCDGLDHGGGRGGLGSALIIGSDAPDGLVGKPTPGGGSAGQGQDDDGSPACTRGGEGPDGEAGSPGPGATSDALGQLTSEGFLPASGSAGTAGTHGRGGGGGGAALPCDGTGFARPGSGGGAGGCRGTVGQGGGGGGSSVALASHNADVSLRFASLTASTGGTGGAGQPGQSGQLGGYQPNLTFLGCQGGEGGDGGDGGAGGGGRGGHGVAVLYVGTRPTVDASVTPLQGSPGEGGPGGVNTPQNTGGTGAPGVAAPFLELE